MRAPIIKIDATPNGNEVVIRIVIEWAINLKDAINLIFNRDKDEG